MKKCHDCGKNKTRKSFYKHSVTPDGLSYRCKMCEHLRGLKRPNRFIFSEDDIWKNNRKRTLKNIKFTREQFNEAVLRQGGKCPICLRYGPEINLSIDHSHKTNVFRGIICSICNLGLGNFNDDISRLGRAIEYLNKDVILKIA